MIKTIVLLHNDNLYQSQIEIGEEISFGSHKKDNVYVQDFSAKEINVKWKTNGFSVSTGKKFNCNQDTIPLDTIFVLDRKSKTAVFIASITSESDYEIRLPYNCILKIGRNEENDIAIRLPFISGEHFVLKNESGNIRIEDLGSTNGLYLNGKKVRIARVKSGDIVSILSVNFKLLNGQLIIQNTGKRIQIKDFASSISSGRSTRPENQIVQLKYRRSPRTQEMFPSEDIILSNAPSKGQSLEKRRGLFSSLAGSGAMLASSFVMGVTSPALLAARAASLVSPISSAVSSRGSNKKQKKKLEQYEALRREKYGAYIEDQKAKIESVAKVQRDIITHENPSPAECVEILFELKCSLWERMPSDRDFLDVRIGMGYEDLCVKVKSKQDDNAFQMEDDDIRVLSEQIIEETRIVDHVPARVSLKKNPTIGIVGNRQKVYWLLKNILVELTTTHCFEDVRIAGIFAPEELSMWESLKWLPHVWSENNEFRLLAFNKNDAYNLCEYLNDLIKTRREEIGESGSFRKNRIFPHYLIIAGSKDLIEKDQIMYNLLLNTPELGITTLFLFDEIYLLPNQCQYIIDLNYDPCKFDRRAFNEKTFFTMDTGIDADQFDTFTRRMSAIELEGLSAKSALSDSITFLQGFGVQKVDDLNVWNRWQSSVPYKSLGAPIGLLAGDKLFYLDIHEKAHGPHGLVAGTTGSGKSELLQTWILSMALTFHPYDVSFVLIDYKGGGMANLLEPLPHVVGKITNIGSNISRSLISLQSEIKRRLAVFDRYGVNHIDKYQKLFKNHQADEPLPHLIIVADEFAELKKEEPEFMSGLISASRVGRSLGIHLILATQKPGGVVDDQIQSNSRFRLCLKVQDSTDSREMIKRSDAAKITQAGRAFIRVGEDEYFDLFQSFWSGAPYFADKTAIEDKNEVRIVALNGKRIKTVSEERKVDYSDVDELTAVIHHICLTANQYGIKKLPGPWMPELPERLTLDIFKHDFAFDGRKWNRINEWLAVPVGMFDNPTQQTQGTQYINFAKEGHYGIYGAPGTGKTTFLKSLVLGLGLCYSPKDVNIYILDCGGWSMSIFSNMPHVGGVALDNEEEKFQKFEKLITEEFEIRKKAFLEHSVNSLSAYRDAVSDDIPAILIAIDNIVPIFELYPDFENFLINLARDGATYGIYLVYTSNSTSGVRYKVLQNIRGAVTFELTDKGEYTTIVGRLEGKSLPKTLGRAFFKSNPPMEFQGALPVKGDTDRDINLNIKELIGKMNAEWTGVRPKPIPVMPDIVTDHHLLSEYQVRTILPVGIKCEDIKPAFVDLTGNYSFVISGSNTSDMSRLLGKYVKMVSSRFPDTKVFIFDSPKISLSQYKSIAYKYTIADDSENVSTILSELVGYLNERQKGQNQARTAEGSSFDIQAYIASFELLCIVIDDLKAFVDAVTNAEKDTMERICRMAQGLGVIVMCSGKHDDIAKYNEIETLTRAVISNQNGLAIDGSPSNHSFFKNDLKYSEKDIPAQEGFGFLFINGKCAKVKLLNDGENG